LAFGTNSKLPDYVELKYSVKSEYAYLFRGIILSRNHWGPV